MEIKNQFKENCDRSAVLRIFWLIPIGVILYIWGIVAGILIIVHFLQILFTGKRHQKIAEHLSSFFKFQWQWTLYIISMDDTKPEWNPLEFMK